MTADVPVQRREAVAVRRAATGAAGICTAFAGMQVALAAGAPLGEHVWGGGQERVLRSGGRVVSVGAAAVLAAFVARRSPSGEPLGR